MKIKPLLWGKTQYPFVWRAQGVHGYYEVTYYHERKMYVPTFNHECLYYEGFKTLKGAQDFCQGDHIVDITNLFVLFVEEE